MEQKELEVSVYEESVQIQKGIWYFTAIGRHGMLMRGWSDMKGETLRIGCAAASLLMGISGTYAYYRSSVETINKIAVGDVNIGIWEYEEDGDGEKKYEGPENGIVLPSQVISKFRGSPIMLNHAMSG